MTVSIIDAKNYPRLVEGKGKKILFDSPDFHVWIHGTYAGHIGTMHKHTADETFFCIEGEATFHFKDRAPEKLTPGMLIVIPKGDFYVIENSGSGYLNLLGTRCETNKKPRFGEAGNLMPSTAT